MPLSQTFRRPLTAANVTRSGRIVPEGDDLESLGSSGFIIYRFLKISVWESQ
jgi:hypothetical protein